MGKLIEIGSPAFKKLQEEIVKTAINLAMLHIDSISTSEWLSGDEAMKLLNYPTRSVLMRLRDRGEIKYIKISRSNIIYNRESILKYNVTRNSRR